jgi:hypothetical protein
LKPYPRWRLYKRWWLRRAVRSFEFDHAWILLHIHAAHEYNLDDTDRRLMVALARRCVETAPDDQPGMRGASKGWLHAYERGSRVKFATYPTTILEPVSEELAAAVEEVFIGFEGDQL